MEAKKKKRNVDNVKLLPSPSLGNKFSPAKSGDL